MQKIKKGDTVQVVAGRDKGKRGKVLEVFPTEGKVRVEGVFVQKRHLKAGASQKIPNGGIIDKPGKIDVSNVKYYSDKLGRPVSYPTHKIWMKKIVRPKTSFVVSVRESK